MLTNLLSSPPIDTQKKSPFHRFVMHHLFLCVKHTAYNKATTLRRQYNGTDCAMVKRHKIQDLYEATNSKRKHKIL